MSGRGALGPRPLAPKRACGGEGGIRTRDGLPRTAFPVRRHSPLGDLSPTEVDRSHFEDGEPSAPVEGGPVPRRDAHDARRYGGPWEGSAEHRSERTSRCVSEERRATTRPGTVRSTERVAERAGFEPAVLSHTAFRERHHQPLGHLSAGEDTKPDPANPLRPRQRAASGANSASASSRRIPLTTLIRRGSAGCWASWMTDPAAPSWVFAAA